MGPFCQKHSHWSGMPLLLQSVPRTVTVAWQVAWRPLQSVTVRVTVVTPTGKGPELSRERVSGQGWGKAPGAAKEPLLIWLGVTVREGQESVASMTTFWQMAIGGQGEGVQVTVIGSTNPVQLACATIVHALVVGSQQTTGQGSGVQVVVALPKVNVFGQPSGPVIVHSPIGSQQVPRGQGLGMQVPGMTGPPLQKGGVT